MKNYNAIHSILLIFVFFISSASAQTMYIRQKGGASVSYDVNNINLMKFTSGNLNVVKTDKSTDVYALTSLQYVNFGEFETAIRPVSASNNSLSVYPNPVKDALTISNSDLEGSMIVITSIEGKQMLTKQLNSVRNTTIDVSELSRGFYVCKLYKGKNVLSTKFLKL